MGFEFFAWAVQSAFWLLLAGGTLFLMVFVPVLVIVAVFAALFD